MEYTKKEYDALPLEAKHYDTETSVRNLLLILLTKPVSTTMERALQIQVSGLVLAKDPLDEDERNRQLGKLLSEALEQIVDNPQVIYEGAAKESMA